MVNQPQNADAIYPRNTATETYLIPFDFSTTGQIRVEYSDRRLSTKWNVLIENIDYTVKINLSQGSIVLSDPDNLLNFNWIRIKRVIPVSQPYALPNAYSPPNIEGIIDNQNKILQQVSSTIGILEERPPLEIEDPNAIVGRFTLISDLDPPRLSGSDLSNIFGVSITADVDLTCKEDLQVDGDATVAKNATVGKGLTVGETTNTKNLNVAEITNTKNLNVAETTNTRDLNVSNDTTTANLYATAAVIQSLENTSLISNRAVIDTADISTLVVGTQTLEFDFYVNFNATFHVDGGSFGWRLNSTANDRTNLILGTYQGKTVITNGPSIISYLNVGLNYLAKGGPNNTLISSRVLDDGSLVTVSSDTVVTGDLTTKQLFADAAVLGALESNNIITKNATVNQQLTVPTDAIFSVDGGSFGWHLESTANNRTNLVLGVHEGKTVITNEVNQGGGGGGDIQPGTVGQPAIYSGTSTLSSSNNLLVVRPTALDTGKVLGATAVGTIGWVQQATTNYDSSGVLSGLTMTPNGNDAIFITRGTGVAYSATKASYEKITINTDLTLTLPVTDPLFGVHVLLREKDGTLEAYYSAVRPSNTAQIHDIYLGTVAFTNNQIGNIYPSFRNLNQQLAQVINVLDILLPWSNIEITLNMGEATLNRLAGQFMGFGVKNIPTSADKFNTSKIERPTENNATFRLVDVGLTDNNFSGLLSFFPLPASWDNSGTLEPIPIGQWGYYVVIVNANGDLRFIYPEQIFSDGPNPGDAQIVLREILAIYDPRPDGFATIGVLGLMGGTVAFTNDSAHYYANIGQLGEVPNVVTSDLPNPDLYDEGDRLTVIESRPGVKEWVGAPDKVKPSTAGYFAVYDATGEYLEGVASPTTPTGKTGEIAYFVDDTTLGSKPGELAPVPVAADQGKALVVGANGAVGWVSLPDIPDFPENSVKTGTTGKPAYYDTTSTVSSSTGHIVPNPEAADVSKVLGATAEGAIGWVEVGGGSGEVGAGTVGQPAVYVESTKVGSSNNLLVVRPTTLDTGKVYTAIGPGTGAWKELSGSIDNIVITSIVSSSQQAGDILSTLSYKRILNNGNRIYDDFSGREILPLDGRSIDLRQYPGLYLKAMMDVTYGTPPNAIQCTGTSFTGFRQTRFFRTPTNEQYLLEITAAAYNSTTGITVWLCTVDSNGTVTRVRSHTTWGSTSSVSNPYLFGIFFVVDPANNYYGYNVYTGLAGNYHTYFYNLANGTAASSSNTLATNEWSYPNNFTYFIYGGHLYVFRPTITGGNTLGWSKIKIAAVGTGGPTLNGSGRTVNNNRRDAVSYKHKFITPNSIVLFYFTSTTYTYACHFIFDLITDTFSSEYIHSTNLNTPYGKQGSVYRNGVLKFPFTGGNTTLSNTLLTMTVGSTTLISTDNTLPGTANIGWSHYDQHPKYPNICAALKNDKRQLFLSYDYAETWKEVGSFNFRANFSPTTPPTGSGGVAPYHTVSQIWLDENTTEMIFTGWFVATDTTYPCVLQLNGAISSATLKTRPEGDYIITTEFLYQPVVWFDAGGGLVIGETYHKQGLPLAQAVTGEGVISDIAWASGTNPPSQLINFACSKNDIGTWAVDTKNIYLADDGYSFARLYTVPPGSIIADIEYYDQNNAVIATYIEAPTNLTTIALIDKRGNVTPFYSVNSTNPVPLNLAVSENLVCFCKQGINQVLWADRSDLVFSNVTTAEQIKTLVSTGYTTYGLNKDGTTIFRWTGIGQDETIMRTFTGVVITDIACAPGKLFAVGNTGNAASAYVYDERSGTFEWTDYLGLTTSNTFNTIDVSSNSNDDLIIGCATGFYQSSDALMTEPVPLGISSGTLPTGIKKIDIDTTGLFTVFFGVNGSDQGFTYRGGDIASSLVTDLMECGSFIVGITPIGYLIRKDIKEDFWTRKPLQLQPDSTFSQRQPIALGLSGKVYIIDDQGHIGVSDDGINFSVANGSPIGANNRPGSFIGGLAGNVSLLGREDGYIDKSDDDWQTRTIYRITDPDEQIMCFSRDLSRNDIVYAVTRKPYQTTDWTCRVIRLTGEDDWASATTLLSRSLTVGKYFTRIVSYNQRIVIVYNDGQGEYSTNGGINFSPIQGYPLVDSPATVEGITSLWIENTTDMIYAAKKGGLFYSSFGTLNTLTPWIKEDLPVSSDQQMGAHIIDKARTYGIIGNIGISIYWRKYDV